MAGGMNTLSARKQVTAAENQNKQARNKKLLPTLHDTLLESFRDLYSCLPGIAHIYPYESEEKIVHEGARTPGTAVIAEETTDGEAQ
jgi:hypothetical protein